MDRPDCPCAPNEIVGEASPKLIDLDSNFPVLMDVIIFRECNPQYTGRAEKGSFLVWKPVIITIKAYSSVRGKNTAGRSMRGLVGHTCPSF